MTPAHARYIAIEAGIGAAVNAVLSAAFLLVVFTGAARVPFAGAHGLIVDAVPQSFMVVLMSVLVPTVLTRRRVAAGALAGLPARHPAHRARHPAMRALVAAVAGAGLGAALWSVPLAFGVASVPFGALVAMKIAYGATLGAAVAAVAAARALGDG